jgi:hypothetical protein
MVGRFAIVATGAAVVALVFVLAFPTSQGPGEDDAASALPTWESLKASLFPASARKPASQDRRASEREPAHSPSEHKPAAPPRVPAPREPAPPWKLAKQRGTFEGDVAIKELRERMALAPDQPPEPPMRDDGGSVFGMVGRLAGLVAMAAIGAYGFVWISTPPDQPDEHGFALAAYENPAAAEEPGAAPALNNAASPNNGGFRPAVFQPPSVPASNFRAATLRPRDEAPPVDRPQLLAPVPWPAPDAARDLASKPRETPTTGVAAPSIAPPPADTTASPRGLPPAEAEIKTAPPAVAPRIDVEEIATLLARGRTYLANGDVSAARLAFRRAAESGDAQAALALGGTFDPMVLKSLGAIGVAADPAQARTWYQKAAELGSRDAPQRLNQLAQSTR